MRRPLLPLACSPSPRCSLACAPSRRRRAAPSLRRLQLDARARDAPRRAASGAYVRRPRHRPRRSSPHAPTSPRDPRLGREALHDRRPRCCASAPTATLHDRRGRRRRRSTPTASARRPRPRGRRRPDARHERGLASSPTRVAAAGRPRDAGPRRSATSRASTRPRGVPPPAGATTATSAACSARCRRPRVRPGRARPRRRRAPARWSRALRRRRRRGSDGVDEQRQRARRRADAGHAALAADRPTLSRSRNVPSDNFYAETLLKDLGARFGGAGTTAAGAAVVRAPARRVRRAPARRRRLGALARRPHHAAPGRRACSSAMRDQHVAARLRGRRWRSPGAPARCGADARHGRPGPLPREDRHAARRQRARGLLHDRRRRTRRLRVPR